MWNISMDIIAVDYGKTDIPQKGKIRDIVEVYIKIIYTEDGGMQWFNDMKIVYKLIIMVAVSIISLLAVGYTGYHYLHTFNTSLNEMYTTNLRGVAALNENRSMGQGIMSDVLDILVTADPKRASEDSKDIEKRVKIVEENFKIFEDSGLNAFETDKMKELRGNWERYGAARKQVVEMALTNRKAEAYEFYNTSVRPAAEATQNNLRDLAKYNQDEAAESNKKNSGNFLIANRITISVISVAVLILLVLGGLICRIISRNLQLVVGGMQQVAGGNLTLGKLGIDSKDETGQVADAGKLQTKTVCGAGYPPTRPPRRPPPARGRSCIRSTM
jgi:methyl-accepting chemotaxis protein